MKSLFSSASPASSEALQHLSGAYDFLAFLAFLAFIIYLFFMQSLTYAGADDACFIFAVFILALLPLGFFIVAISFIFLLSFPSSSSSFVVAATPSSGLFDGAMNFIFIS